MVTQRDGPNCFLRKAGQSIRCLSFFTAHEFLNPKHQPIEFYTKKMTTWEENWCPRLHRLNPRTSRRKCWNLTATVFGSKRGECITKVATSSRLQLQPSPYKTGPNSRTKKLKAWGLIEPIRKDTGPKTLSFSYLFVSGTNSFAAELLLGSLALASHSLEETAAKPPRHKANLDWAPGVLAN